MNELMYVISAGAHTLQARPASAYKSRVSTFDITQLRHVQEADGTVTDDQSVSQTHPSGARDSRPEFVMMSRRATYLDVTERTMHEHTLTGTLHIPDAENSTAYQTLSCTPIAIMPCDDYMVA